MATNTAPRALDDLLDRLAAFEPSGTFPVLSLYLDARSNERGRDSFEPFLRKELPARARGFPLRSPERESYEQDAERIRRYLRDELSASANGVALFACAADNDFFEAVQLGVPFEEHRLYVSDQPHLYPLAYLLDRYRRYAALLVDTNAARLFVFGLGRPLRVNEIRNTKTNRSMVGGWSQMRYQRHVDNIHQQHAKEVVDTLARVVRAERIEHVIVAGDEVVVPMLREQLPGDVAEKVVDVLRLEIGTPDHEVLEATLEAFRRADEQTDAARVRRLFDEQRGGGLAVVGREDTLAALQAGQVDELVLAAVPAAAPSPETPLPPATATGAPPGAEPAEAADRKEGQWDELVTLARQTSARVMFVENPELLREAEGVGAFLRYRLTADGPAVPPLMETSERGPAGGISPQEPRA